MKKVLFTAMILTVFVLGCATSKTKESKENTQGLKKWMGARLYTIPWNEVRDIYEDEKMSEEEYKKYGDVRAKSGIFIWCHPDKNITFDLKKGILEFLSPCEVLQIYFEYPTSGSITGNFMVTGKSRLILDKKFAIGGCAHKTVILENSLEDKSEWEAYECRITGNRVWYEKVDEGVDVKKFH